MTQNEQVREHLVKNGSIDALTAFIEYGIMRLSARVYDLKAAGMPITTEIRMKNGKQWASYKLESRPTVCKTEGRQEGALPSENITES